MNANEGIEDGDALRIAGLTKLYPNLIQVPEVVTKVDFVGIVRGHKIAEMNTVGCKTVTAADTVEQLFTLLENGRLGGDFQLHPGGLTPGK